MKPPFRENDLDKPGQCQHCGCEPDATPLCEHLTPPKDTIKPLEGTIVNCPRCPLFKYKWYQFNKKSRQRLSKIIPMTNPSENNYVCEFCGYGVRL